MIRRELSLVERSGGQSPEAMTCHLPLYPIRSSAFRIVLLFMGLLRSRSPRNSNSDPA